MQTGFIVFSLFVPLFLDGCCVENRPKKRAGPRLDVARQHYRAVEGELFIIPCLKSVDPHEEQIWSRTGDGTEEKGGPSLYCGRKFLAEAKHSGKYMCLKCGSTLSFYLQVVERNGLRCSQLDESSKNLLVGAGGAVACPGLNCSDNADVIWYKDNKAVSEQRRASCQRNGWLRLCRVSELDTGAYFCDRQITEQGVRWNFRRAVNVTAIPYYSPSYSPRIIYPDDNTTEEVVLGRPHTLVCEIYFPFEIKFSPEVWWYMHYGGDRENMTLLQMESRQQEKETLQEFKVTQTAILKEVTPQHLNNTFSCVARNTVGNSSATIRLRKKIKVTWPWLVGYPIMSLLLVAGLSVVLHVRWLEVQLIYRSHFPHGKNTGEEKEFDVFLSYVWSPTSAEAVGVSSSLSGLDTDDEVAACLSSMDKLSSDEGETTRRPLEEYLAEVLEDQWGYRLCLMERDVLPGGAYTNDVVVAIQRSQMLICLLSADYLANSNAVFILESGVQALLSNSDLKLLLIWTNRTTASSIEPDPPLPALVQRSLKVLPSLDWTSRKTARATTKFWRSLRKTLPGPRVKLVSLM